MDLLPGEESAPTRNAIHTTIRSIFVTNQRNLFHLVVELRVTFESFGETLPASVGAVTNITFWSISMSQDVLVVTGAIITTVRKTLQIAQIQGLSGQNAP